MPEKPSFDEMPKMVPHKDDIRRRQYRDPEPVKAKASDKVSRQGSTPWVLIVLVLLAGVSIVYLALENYSKTQLLASYEERIDLAAERIVNLERSLTQTDESVALNGTAINAQFKAIKAETDIQMSEIRKLWDVANKRNRNWIEDNQSTLADQQEVLAGLQTQLGALATSQDDAEVGLATLGDEFSLAAARLADAQTQVDALNDSMAQLIATNLEERVLTLTLNQENMTAEQDRARAAIRSNQQVLDDIGLAMQSIDAYRRETNQRLAAVTTQLERLGARVQSLTGTAE